MKIKRTKDRISYFEGEKELAYVLFPKIDDHTVVIQSTYVDPILRGQGIASLLLEEAYTIIKDSHCKAILECSYAKHYFQKNEDKQDIILSCPYTSVG